jgi:hypothetical protein
MPQTYWSTPPGPRRYPQYGPTKLQKRSGPAGVDPLRMVDERVPVVLPVVEDDLVAALLERVRRIDSMHAWSVAQCANRCRRWIPLGENSVRQSGEIPVPRRRSLSRWGGRARWSDDRAQPAPPRWMGPHQLPASPLAARPFTSEALLAGSTSPIGRRRTESNSESGVRRTPLRTVLSPTRIVQAGQTSIRLLRRWLTCLPASSCRPISDHSCSRRSITNPSRPRRPPLWSPGPEVPGRSPAPAT